MYLEKKKLRINVRFFYHEVIKLHWTSLKAGLIDKRPRKLAPHETVAYF